MRRRGFCWVEPTGTPTDGEKQPAALKCIDGWHQSREEDERREAAS